MKDKIFKLCYNIDYTAASTYPNNLVLIGSGGDPASPASPPDRMLFSYRREIKDKKGGDVFEETKFYVQEIEIKKLKKENEFLKKEIELLELEPIPGREFMKLFIEEFKKDDTNLFKDFIEAYIPTMEQHFNEMISK